MNKERLLKLAGHLLSGKLGHEVFDFSLYNDRKGPICGTRGCAIGELPVIFPVEWIFTVGGFPRLRKQYFNRPEIDAANFFNISENESYDLFVSIIWREIATPIQEITKEHIAQRILDFVKMNESQVTEVTKG